MINCPNCGAGMYFDIKSQLLRCGSCDAKMPVADYKKDIEAEEHTYENTVCICKSCGAQLMAPSEQATAFCPYCGNQSMIPSRIKAFKTNKIIPFKKTREDIEKSFENYTKHKLFLPKDYKENSGTDSFRGVYIPHYNYKVNFEPGTFETFAHHDFDEGSESHHVTYMNEVTTPGGYAQDIVRDASEAFDDSFAAAIAPYSHSEAVTFREGYIGDFYADIPSVGEDAYSDEVMQEAIDELKEKITGACAKKEMEHDFDNKKLALRVRPDSARADLYPVWFMTRKMKHGRVAYAVANGQTGKIAMDLPVSKGRFFLAAAALTLALFILTSFAFGFMIPGTLSGICIILLAVSFVILCVSGYKIRKRESMRSSVKQEGPKLPDVKPKLEKLKKGVSTSTIVISVLIIVRCIPIFRSLNFSARIPVILCIVGLITGAIAFVALLSLTGSDGSFGKLIVNGVLSIVFLAACLILNIRKPFQDYYYIGAAFISQALVIINCLSVIGLFDRLCTHPAPDFFSRKGAAQDD